MASATSQATEYKVKFGNYTLTIIDTPGFGDSRGTKKDDEHYELIR